MNINKISKLLALATVLAAATVAELKAGSAFLEGDGAIGSGDPNTVLLTVAKGGPSGLYSPGTKVTVIADAAPKGTHFTGWTGDVEILANPSLATTTAIVPFMAVRISANYSEILETPAPSPTPTSANATPNPTPSPTTVHWGG
jgi:Divergent InlB B-repeat domain